MFIAALAGLALSVAAPVNAGAQTDPLVVAATRRLSGTPEVLQSVLGRLDIARTRETEARSVLDRSQAVAARLLIPSPSSFNTHPSIAAFKT